MKKLAIAVLIFSAFNALACQEESQFIANVSATRFESNKCILSVIDFKHYSSSAICPLWESDVLETGITTEFGPETCRKLTNTEISGYLIRPVGSQQIFLD